jgi:glutamate-5-semialdehyde dehydrogenase
MLDKTVSQADIAALMADIGRRAKAAARPLAIASTDQKNTALNAMADAIFARRQEILDANALDVEAALASDMAASFVDRLKLDDSRIDAITDGIRAIAALPDPVGDVIAEWDRPNGLRIERVRTPLGVIGVIYESRPNVTADAGALCLKSGNAVILRGGSDSFHSSRAIHACLTQGLESAGLPADAIQMIPVSDRAAVGELLTGLGGTVDVIVPRGGKSLVARVQADARVPVFAHLEGLCHIYVDKPADPAMARAIVVNAKMRRTGICGAAETLLLDSAIDRAVAPLASWQILSLPAARSTATMPMMALLPEATRRSEDDWRTEYLDAIIAARLSTASMAPSTISPSGRRAIPRPSSPRIWRWSSASSTKWIPPSCCTTPRPSSPTAANSAWARKSASPPERCTRAGPSASSN